MDNRLVRSTGSEISGRIYANAGNAPLIALLNADFRSVLDVGCGTGDNAVLLKSSFPECEVYGITHCALEAERAGEHLKRCWVFDVEGELPREVAQQSYDVLIFSHVLEHLRDPASVLSRFVKMLKHDGILLIAVPNVLCWRQRWQFLLGRFEYQMTGILDDTHLRFFTYMTADRYLLAKTPELRVTFKGVTGGVPLWILRRHVFPTTWSDRLDAWGCRHWPNLFGGQVLLRVIKT